MRHKTMALTSAALLAAAVCAASAPAHAADGTIAMWDMNEPVGATVMQDSSGNGVTGQIGNIIQTGKDDGAGATYYKWPFAPPNTTPPDSPRRIIVTSGATNPGTRDFTVSLRFRTTFTFGNIIQKGQNGNVGGYWKIEAPKGHVTCLFKGVNGSVLVNSPTGMNDGQWHTIVCSRTATGAKMTIDGTKIRTKAGVSGSISNTVPVSIGGKKNCDQVKVTCDFFSGDIDWIKLSSP